MKGPISRLRGLTWEGWNAAFFIKKVSRDRPGFFSSFASYHVGRLFNPAAGVA
jgi:hypothetical protein